MSCLAVLAAACGRAAEANDSATTTTVGETVAPVETRLVVVSEPGATEAPPLSTVDPVQVDNCVKYVPYAADQGNPYMQMTWAGANEDLTELRAVCEELGRTSPESLQDISDAQEELDAFFNQFTTVPGGPTTAPSGASTIPTATGSTVPACPAGSHLSEDGFCVAD